MPVISRFDGIVIRIYFSQSEHDPAHIHVKFAEYSAVIGIENNTILEGYLPNRELKKVKEWVLVHEEELLEIWNTQNFRKIEPLY